MFDGSAALRGSAICRRLLLLLLWVVASRASLADAEQGALSREELYRRAKGATVEVLVDGHLAGSGWFADAQGWVLTAAHMVPKPDARVELRWVAGRVKAEPVAVDLGHDATLLKAEPRDGGYPALPLAEKVPPAGADVFLMGTPVFRHAVLGRGMIAHDEPTYDHFVATWHGYIETIQLAATVQQGVSGGPWLNDRGEVVGLQSGMLAVNGVSVGIAHMAPVGALRSLLCEKTNASTPTIGAAFDEVWQQGPDFLKRFPADTEGLIVASLKEDGPAARAGLKQGEVVIEADGRKLALRDELVRSIRTKKPGDSIKLTILQPDGTGTREVTVPVGYLEVGWPQPERPASQQRRARREPLDLYEHARQASLEVIVAGRLEGSGWLADAKGLAVTAAHVVRKHADRVEVISPVAGRLPAKVIAVDRGHDLALLELPKHEKAYPALEVAEGMPPPTSSIFLYGVVQFRHGLLVRGTIARREPSYEYLFELKQYIRAVYVVAPTPNGTSGGCWLDRRGRVVGNQSGFMLRNGDISGIAYVIPPEAIRRLVQTRKSAETPTIGAAVEEIWEQKVDWIEQFPAGTEGIVPVRIHENGPAAKAGIEPRSLVITKVDGKPVHYRDELLDLVRARRPGDEMTLEVLRPDAKSTAEIKLRLESLEGE